MIQEKPKPRKGYNPKAPLTKQQRNSSAAGGGRTINQSGDPDKIRKNWEKGQRRAAKGKF